MLIMALQRDSGAESGVLTGPSFPPCRFPSFPLFLLPPALPLLPPGPAPADLPEAGVCYSPIQQCSAAAPWAVDTLKSASWLPPPEWFS